MLQGGECLHAAEMQGVEVMEGRQRSKFLEREDGLIGVIIFGCRFGTDLDGPEEVEVDGFAVAIKVTEECRSKVLDGFARASKVGASALFRRRLHIVKG